MLDAADLAILEIDIQKLDPLARNVAQLLIDMVRGQRDASEAAATALGVARDHATDAGKALTKLREHLKEAPVEADDLADTIEEELDAIQEIDA